MAMQTFQWRRFWYSRDSEPAPDVDGFLADPERRKLPGSEPSSLHSVDVLTNRCVAFLGEPSSGKSRTIGAEGIDRPGIEEFARSKGDFVQWIDLRDFDNSAGLSAALRGDRDNRELAQ